MLEPDRDQLEIFTDALLRYAGNDGYISVRAFHEGDSSKPFRVTPTALKGGLGFLIDVAEDDARRAAQYPQPVVFCPPLCTFSSREQAREGDILAGLTLSVECDRGPAKARLTLETLLGRATVVVKSGGVWTNGNAESEDKVHLHWRLTRPACGTDIAKLKQARILGARIVGGDPSNAPVCHPIRWPGSWHRKAEPRLCTIETLNADIEIDLDAALRVLTQAALATASTDYTDSRNGDDWATLVGKIVSGESYHAPLVSLAARLVGSQMHDGTAVKLLRSLMDSSRGPRDQRWEARYDSIPRYVFSAREKFGSHDQKDEDGTDAKKQRFTLVPFHDIPLDSAAAYLVKDLIPSAGLIVVWGPPKCGKSFKTFDVMMCVVRGIPYRGRRVRQGAVVYLALEGGKGFRRRIEAYRREHNITEAPFYLITDRTDLIKDHELLIAAIKTQTADAPVAVVIDTLNRSLAGSESKDEDMAAYIRAADAIREAFNCAVVIVHHCGVDGTRPRGHTSLTGAVDAQIAVTRDEATNDIVATVEWLKDGKEGDVIISRLQLVELGVDEEDEPITSCVILPVEGDRPPRASRTPHKRESKSVKAFRAAFTEALDGCGKTIHVRGDGPAVRAVDLKYVKGQFDLRWATGEGDPDKQAEARRKTFKRLTDSTMPADFATWVDGEVEWIWRTT